MDQYGHWHDLYDHHYPDDDRRASILSLLRHGGSAADFGHRLVWVDLASHRRPGAVTGNEAPQPSPGPRARIAGGLWVLVIAAGVFALLVRDALIVPGDGAATAANILAAEPVFRSGFVADLVSAGAYVGTAFLLYDLLR